MLILIYVKVVDHTIIPARSCLPESSQNNNTTDGFLVDTLNFFHEDGVPLICCSQQVLLNIYVPELEPKSGWGNVYLFDCVWKSNFGSFDDTTGDGHT